jgi:FkbH-like protein
MKLVEALQIANTVPDGPLFQAVLACGFTPLHLETAVKAHFRQRLPARKIGLRTGLYGDLAGTLENVQGDEAAVLVVLEWGDLDTRLSWRSAGRITDDVVSESRARLRRIEKAINALAQKAPVALSLPALPLAPVFHTPGNELNRIEAALREMLYGLAASTSAAVLHPETLERGTGHELRMELLSGFPYSFAYADVLAANLVSMLLPMTPKKGIITDLDGTLWDGVLGDDGPDGISWGLERKTQFHGLYQNLLNSLAEAGILLGVATKNDAGLVGEALTRKDLVIQPQHLFPIEAHWHPKGESVERILEAWNVAPESVVFVDDNPLELEQVKRAFPTIECLQFRKDEAGFLVELRDRCGKREIREEDKLRVASLRTDFAARRIAEKGVSLDDLLSAADARVTLRWGKHPPDLRALELVNKTNQFNLNGIRYTEGDWYAYLSDPKTHLLVVEYEDKFGKLGKIAVLSGREQRGAFEVEVWVMSCRAFSRRIEHQCLRLLLDRWDPVRFKFARNERNAPMLDFLGQVAPRRCEVRRAEFGACCPPLFHQTECMSA